MDIYFDPIFLKHDTGLHPENSGRLDAILGSLDKEKIKKPGNGEEYLNIAHTSEYIERVKLTSKMGGRLDPDTPVSAKSYEAACYAVGAAVEASENALKGASSFALVRPPGHHAFSDHGSGFCIFNNIAVAALRVAQGENKVFILDIDIHHGNGTEEIVLDKENIQFLSIHQSHMYPGSGLEDEGKNCINIPMPPGTGDREYVKVLEKKVRKEIEDFRPDIVGVSAGFDAYYLDQGTVAGNAMSLTAKSYEKVREILNPYDCFYSLEGGYNPRSIVEGMQALTGL
jgi:acetoin utilization deacetylase AcuC-like enzyme